jgi:epoxyqueuosine reductase
MDPTALRDRIVRKTVEFGADDAGVCLASDLLKGPAHSKYPLPEGVEDNHSILVFALSHPPDKPELDYFIKKDGFRFGNSKGNKQLMDISSRIGQWLEKEGIVSHDLHYYVERGGVFLKGAAVLAGLGVMGVNNLFMHPGYGPRIRLRAHLVNIRLPPSGRLEFDPCMGCLQPCLNACPEDALDETGYDQETCLARFDRDDAEGMILPADGDRPAAREIHFCRECELCCSYTGTMESAEQ